MKKYQVYVNALIEINQVVEANSEDEAIEIAYSLVKADHVVNCDIEVSEVEE